MTACKIIDKEFAKSLLPERPTDTNKGTFGKVLNFSGCKEYVGAAYLSSVTPLKVGAGLVELASSDYVRNKVSCMCPDIIYKDTKNDYYLSKLPKDINLNEYSAIIIGCGLGNNKLTQKFVKDFINSSKEIKTPVIYDADALNIIAEKKYKILSKNSILTPHPGEMARLMGTDTADIQSDREKWAKAAAAKYNSTVVLKGYNSIIAYSNGDCYIETTATNVLAKAGMGDVLSGIIAGFCAQGVTAKNASILGTYIHAQAGHQAEKVETSYGVLASELIKFIPDGIKAVIM